MCAPSWRIAFERSILAGGWHAALPRRPSLLPSPWSRIAGKPILWHVMKDLRGQRISADVVICCGYRGQLIKSYFVNYFTKTNYTTSR